MNRRFNHYCEDLGLSPGLDIHSLRRPYVTYMIVTRDGPLFVRHQGGHEHASTTALYTSVSSDDRVKTLPRALDSTVQGRPCRAGRLNHMKREIDDRQWLAELMAARECTTAPT